MSRFECNGCEKHHVVESEERPCYCLRTGRANCVLWEEVPVEKSPKLTVEELARRGIEWPEWANWAALNEYMNLVFYAEKPNHTYGKMIYSSKNCEFRITHFFFDQYDWKNSLIQRPETKEALPAWCKIGAWVYQTCNVDEKTGYGRISEVGKNAMRVNFLNGRNDTASLLPGRLATYREARLRRWTKEEMAEKVGKVFDLPEGRCICLRFDGYNCDFLEGCESEDDVAHIIAYDADTFLQYDCKLYGSPCGTLEHLENGKWVE